MGGKGTTAPPPVEQSSGQDDAMMMMLMQGMVNSGGSGQAPPPPTIAPPPVSETVEKIDWAAREEDIRKKMRVDTDNENSTRKGVMDTIHTSPLLDEVTPSISESLLTGKKT